MGGTFNSAGTSAPPTSIVTGFSDGGTALAAALGEFASDSQAKIVLSGALTAATYKEMLAVSGSGVLVCALVQVLDVTERTVGLKCVIDGTTVFDAVSAACTTDNSFMMLMGNAVYQGYISLPFNSSLSLSIKSSLSETDKIQIGYAYYLT
jgi:hypothetical protein